MPTRDGDGGRSDRGRGPADLARRFAARTGGVTAADPARLETLRASIAAEASAAIPEPAAGRAPAVTPAPTAMLSARVPATALRQLKILAAEEGRSVQDLAREALDLLFKARGKPPLTR